MSKNIQDRALGLAGVFQAASLVQQAATKGKLDQADFETSIGCLFIQNPEHAEDIYGNAANVVSGLELIVEQLGDNNHSRDIDLARYVISLLYLEKKLSKHPEMLARISDGLDNAHRQSEHFSITHENVIANLANTYQDTISHLTPRIMVTGAHNYLNQESNANKVRALLLAGIRAAVLWRQSGGSRLKLLFTRKGILQATEGLLAEVKDK